MPYNHTFIIDAETGDISKSCAIIHFRKFVRSILAILRTKSHAYTTARKNKSSSRLET